MGEPLHMVELFGLLREVTARLAETDDLDHALGAVAEVAAQVVPDGAACGITLIQQGAPSLVAHYGPAAERVEEIQYRCGEGPCLNAMSSRDVIVCPDLDLDRRWPAWRCTAIEAGVRALLCAPLNVDAQVVGALNLYSGVPHGIGPEAQFAALLVAEHAGLLLAGVYARGRRGRTEHGLRVALAEGEQVNRAVGIIMAQRGCGAEPAFEVLRTAAVELGAPLREVARRLVGEVTRRGAE